VIMAVVKDRYLIRVGPRACLRIETLRRYSPCPQAPTTKPQSTPSIDLGLVAPDRYAGVDSSQAMLNMLLGKHPRAAAVYPIDVWEALVAGRFTPGHCRAHCRGQFLVTRNISFSAFFSCTLCS